MAKTKASSYDELKQWGGRTYSGMKVGRTHVWDYPDGEWRERKITPDLWQFHFASSKSRKGRGAPEGSGVPVGTGYHWFIQAHQFVHKLDANTYTTFMEGLKHKVAHKRPQWEQWSTERSGAGDRAKVARVLEETLAALKGEHAHVAVDELAEPPAGKVRVPRKPKEAVEAVPKGR